MRVVSASGSTTVFEKRTGTTDTAAAWATATADLAAWRGTTVRVVVEAGDVSGGSLVEAGVDDVRVTHQAVAP
ncbi:hypothetical protein ACFQV2_20195 [Actinokineospora soli]|uniref:Uncharacterized protein n=1 Tax=Actinokineospora soli TaxID=1048753 RepID=A0ABW2TNU2_9PSEU